MTKKLSWRLSKLPTAEEVRELVKDKIITQDEARDILFTNDDTSTTEKTYKDLEDEIKFLRALVDKLSQQNYHHLVEVIKTIEVPIYIEKPWYKPYIAWCSNEISGTTSSNSSFDSLTN